MADIAKSIVAEPLTAEAWACYGWIPVTDTDPADGSHRLDFEWNDVHLNVISHTPEEIEHSADGIVCDCMFRHDTHTQALLTLDVVSLIAVAPAEVDFSDPADLEGVRAFVLHPLDFFVLHRGTWHWGPFPVGDRPVRLYNVQGLRYAEDNTKVDLGARSLALEVCVPGSTVSPAP
ncbi:MAG TPA: ureidoglycolate lyase [Acidimicrobiales bacterium]|nr:ureidoglycolate lyase [Acidimicrobiales bacterium]